jgi:hypothetical protein
LPLLLLVLIIARSVTCGGLSRVTRVALRPCASETASSCYEDDWGQVGPKELPLSTRCGSWRNMLAGHESSWPLWYIDRIWSPMIRVLVPFFVFVCTCIYPHRAIKQLIRYTERYR